MDWESQKHKRACGKNLIVSVNAPHAELRKLTISPTVIET